MKVYVIDIETRSPVDLSSSGVQRYAEHEDAMILCIAWLDVSLYDGTKYSVKSWDCMNDTSADFRKMRDELLAPDVLLVAHNAGFERVCLGLIDDSRWLRPERWLDSAMLCGALGRPRSLRDACRSLRFPEELEKDARGKRLLSMFSIKTPKGKLYEPEERPQEFNELVEYCRQDVLAEAAVWIALEKHRDALFERQWYNDCVIDDTGIPVNVAALKGAYGMYTLLQNRAEKEAQEITGGVSMRSTPGLRKWTAEHGWPIQSFSKASIEAEIARWPSIEHNYETKKVYNLLNLRQTAAGTAGKKYESFLNRIAEDQRIHGAFVSRGAHTGRYAGAGIQPQNLPRGYVAPSLLKYLYEIAENVGNSQYDADTGLEMMKAYAECPLSDMLASLCRGCISAGKGRTFIIADYSAIEARLLAWLSKEKWVEDVFFGDGKIYERTAAEMYHKKVEEVSKKERMAGKIATLALGYGGGAIALQRMANAYGVDFEDGEAQDIVTRWRGNRPMTLCFWKAVEDAFKAALSSGIRQSVNIGRRSQILFSKISIAGREVIRVLLPSGRGIYYWAPRMDVNGEIAVEMYYRSSGGSPESFLTAEAEGASMVRIYGGRLAENITQAVAFDLLLSALLRLPSVFTDNLLSARVVMHIHDEIVVECADDEADACESLLKAGMEMLPQWADGIKLVAEPERSKFYKK